MEATNAQILTNQLEMQETFVKVIYNYQLPHIHKLAHKNDINN